MTINGAQIGFPGREKATNPALNPVNYNGDLGTGKRFQGMAKSDIARMYHSTANLLSDGRVLVAGSNTHQFHTSTGPFPTELRVEAFSPPYLGANFTGVRPQITAVPKAVFDVVFTVGARVGGVQRAERALPHPLISGLAAGHQAGGERGSWMGFEGHSASECQLRPSWLVTDVHQRYS